MSERFPRYSHRGRTCYAVADLPRDVLIQLVEQPEWPLRTEPTETIKDGDGVLVVRTTLQTEAGPVAIAYKRVHRTSLVKRLSRSVGPNRTLQSFLAGHRLLEQGIATARPLAVIVPSRFDVTAPSWLATEWVVGGVDLATFFCRRSVEPIPRRAIQVNAVAVAVGRLVGRMHAAGITHRDLKPQNLMIRCGKRHDDVEAIAIDLDGVRFPGWIAERRRWKDLSRLAIGDRGRGWPGLTRSTRHRFFAAYLDASGLSLDASAAWSKLAAVTTARHRRRGTFPDKVDLRFASS